MRPPETFRAWLWRRKRDLWPGMLLSTASSLVVSLTFDWWIALPLAALCGYLSAHAIPIPYEPRPPERRP